MSKSGSPTLFQLIKSLTQTEQRYVKVFLKKYVAGDSSKYIHLFDAMHKQLKYDESKLKSFPHLPVMKVRLEENILQTLQDFHAEKSIIAKLRSDIYSTEILFHKGLLDHAMKQIIKAKKMAEHYEEYLILYELIKWELKIINAQGYASVSESEMKKIYKEAEDCLDNALNTHRYAWFSDTVYLRIRKYGFFRNKSELKEFGQMMKHPLLQSADNALSIEAKYYFHSSQIGFAELQGKYHEAHKNNVAILKSFEAHPQHIRKDPRKYLSMQQNLVVWMYQLKKYEQALESIEKLKEFIIQQRTSLSEYLFSRSFFYINTVLLLIYSRLGEYDTGVSKVPVFKKEFEKYRIQPLNKEIEWMFYDAAAAVYFGAMDFSEAIYYYNKIIRDKEGDIRSDMQCMTRIMMLIAHYELGNQELLRYMVKWTYRFLVKRNRLFKFETIILDFIGKKSQQMTTRNKVVEAFTELKKELEKLLHDPYQRRPLDDFEYIEWLESKIANKSFASIVQRKNRG